MDLLQLTIYDSTALDMQKYILVQIYADETLTK